MKIYKIALCLLCACLAAACSDEEETILTVVPEATGTFVDERDGYEYHWVRIGGLEWMVENAHYNLNDENNCLFYVDYEDSENYYPEDKFSEQYGYLYSYAGALSAVPEGWRLPSDEDWKSLEKALGMSQSEADALEWRGTEAGRLMKQSGEGTQLAMQLGGHYIEKTGSVTPKYRLIGAYGFFWTATGDEAKEGEYYFYRKLHYKSSQVYRQSTSSEGQMMSVRFVRDASH